MVPAVTAPGGHRVRQGLLFTAHTSSPRAVGTRPTPRGRPPPCPEPQGGGQQRRDTVILTPATSPGPRRFPTPPSPLPCAQTAAGDAARPAAGPERTRRRRRRAAPSPPALPAARSAPAHAREGAAPGWSFGGCR